MKTTREIAEQIVRDRFGTLALQGSLIDAIDRALQAARDEAYDEGVQMERERAAKTAETKYDNRWDAGYVNAGLAIAAAIRSNDAK